MSTPEGANNEQADSISDTSSICSDDSFVSAVSDFANYKWPACTSEPNRYAAPDAPLPDYLSIVLQTSGDSSDPKYECDHLLEQAREAIEWYLVSKVEERVENMATALGTSLPVSVGMNNSSNKRKRGNEDIGRNAKDTAIADQDTYAMLQGIDVSGTDENTRTAQAALAGSMGDQPYPDPTFDASGMSTDFNDTTASGMGDSQNAGAMYNTPGQAQNKPTVGTAEWHEARRANHKEVERRRREVINEGIENIAKIVPGTEKNKGAILQRTAQYIQEQQQEIKQFDSERATFDIALKELTSRNDRLKESLRQAWEDCKKWQKRCRDAGLQFEDYDLDQMGSDNFADADLDAALGP